MKQIKWHPCCFDTFLIKIKAHLWNCISDRNTFQLHFSLISFNIQPWNVNVKDRKIIRKRGSSKEM